MSVTTIVVSRPPCDFGSSHGEAHFDAKTTNGPWAYMCLACYKKHGIGLGTGKGQRLYLATETYDEPVDPLLATRFDDSYDPEPDHDRPTKYDIGPDGEV